MENSVLIFFIILFVPGLWLVFSFRRDIKQRLWFEEQRRIGHERERERATRTSALRHSSRRSAPGHAHTPADIVPPAPANRGAEPTEEATASGQSSVQTESGQDLNASNMGAAFETFLRATTSPSEDVTPSQVDEAFEKFQG